MCVGEWEREPPAGERLSVRRRFTGNANNGIAMRTFTKLVNTYERRKRNAMQVRDDTHDPYGGIGMWLYIEAVVGVFH